MTKPKLTVIVPVYNGGDDLRHCLAALAASRDAQFELIVVDDASTEPVAPAVARHGFRYMRLEVQSGPAFARNRGAEVAEGEVLVFVDADVCVHPDTLARFAAAFAAEPAPDAVIGSYDENPADPGLVSQYKNLLHHHVHHASAGPIATFWSGCGAIRRELFLEVGGFDEQRYKRPAIEDLELGTWLSRSGHRIVLDPTVLCQHRKRWTLWSMVHTDVFHRGIPWVRLALRGGGFPNTLNTSWKHRLTLVLVYLGLLGLGAGIFLPLALLLAVACGGLALGLQHDIVARFVRLRGPLFALRAVPLHGLYFVYGGACVLGGAAMHLVDRVRGRVRADEGTRPALRSCADDEPGSLSEPMLERVQAV